MSRKSDSRHTITLPSIATRYNVRPSASVMILSNVARPENRRAADRTNAQPPRFFLLILTACECADGVCIAGQHRGLEGVSVRKETDPNSFHSGPGPPAYPRTAMRRAAATRPRKAPMKQANRSLVAKPALFLTPVCLRVCCAT